MHRLLVLAALGVAAPAPALNVAFVVVRDAGNPADVSENCNGPGCGSVPYDYALGKFEVTNAQYAEFLNATAASDPLGLYSAEMDSDATSGGITRSGTDGAFSYAAKAGFESKPVVYVSWFDAARFANWLHNGQGSGDTESGAYTLLGGLPEPSNGLTVTRNAGATFFLPSENEWYKAAYYDPGGGYFEYPAGTEAETACVAPASDAGNSANCDAAVGAPTDVGSYGLSVGPYGTFDQGGNAGEWNEQISPFNPDQRGFRGGTWAVEPITLAASLAGDLMPATESDGIGFRVARLVPEPGGPLLVLAGGLVLVLAGRRPSA
jgi:formylglycine-generating enzyme required for sulfatase activity